MKVVFLHPDLGIGGAERLVVDVALSLKKQGHDIRMVTSHHDKNHCFEETKDGTLDVVVSGNFLPTNIFGRLHAFFAYLRMLWAAFYVLCFMSDFSPDLVFCDQVSCCIPLLKLSKAQIIFYCHFPDQLLTQRKNWLKKLYRTPLDWIEEKTTGMADIVLVNSKFTRGVFYNTFKSLKDIKVQILYPTVSDAILSYPVPDESVTDDNRTVFLSINRYERKKNISLAIHAFGELKSQLSSKQYSEVEMVIAGGYDERVSENKEHFLELRMLAEQCGVMDKVTFFKSSSDAKKRLLYHESTVVLYTPSNEHFGIVPLEAMYCCRPVIACNSGGPLETVVDGQTGFLCDSTAEAFASKMKLFAMDKTLSKKMGTAGRSHVHEKFAIDPFTENVKKIIDAVR